LESGTIRLSSRRVKEVAKGGEVKAGPGEKCDAEMEMPNFLNSENIGRITGIFF
jgi:hypothetical protein